MREPIRVLIAQKMEKYLMENLIFCAVTFSQ